MYIAIDTQAALEYWEKNIWPYLEPLDDDEQRYDHFNRWLDWLVGTKFLSGNDIEYLYALGDWAVMVLRLFEIPHEVRDESEL